MATLLIARNADGRIVGRCDERCYDGKQSDCDCCCGGENHGIGQIKAAKNALATQPYLKIPYLDPEDPRQVRVERAKGVWNLTQPTFERFWEDDAVTTQ